MTAQLGDAVRHRLIGDDDIAPHLRIQRLPGNDFAGALRQANEHVHDPDSRCTSEPLRTMRF